VSLISYNQEGFRKGHSTIDNIFTFSSLTLCSLNNSKGFPFNSIKYFSRSFKYIENNNGDNFSTCLTPVRQGKNSDWLLLYCTQEGFRKGHSTIDNIFVLNGLISLYQFFGKKIFCTVVDFRKAFDTVWRIGL
jgi:hypothetical protein